MKVALLVVDYPQPDTKLCSKIARALREVTIQKMPLHVAAFLDDPEDQLVEYIEAHFPGKVVFLNTAELMQKHGRTIRSEVVELVENMREQLCRLAAKHNGRNWAAHFQNLWWYTELAEKNSPGNPLWWHIFRGKLVARIFSESERYSTCIFVGSAELNHLLRQICSTFQVSYQGVYLNRMNSLWLRGLFTRFWGAVCHTFAVATARLRFGKKQQELFRVAFGKPKIFLYTWFPRVWTMREGKWQDMYFGDTLDWLLKKPVVEPFFVARMYDRPDFVSPVTYWKRLRIFKDSKMYPYRGLLLEAEIDPGKVLKTYLDMRDIFRYLRLRNNLDFKKAFVQQGISFYEICATRLTRSVLIHWPHLEVLKNCAYNLARKYKPHTAAVYCFEYMYGRALIKGTKRGAPEVQVIGMQHGPITWMKFLYAGFGSIPDQYSPNLYAVDGPLALEILREGGVPQEIVSVTGPARFDCLWQRAKILEKSSFPAGAGPREEIKRFKVLVAPGLHDTQFMLTFAFTALLQDPKLHLIVKKHPKVSLSFVEELIQSLQVNHGDRGAKVEIVREGDIYDWMIKSDIFLSTYSSTGVEAIAFGLPVILLVSKRVPEMSLFYGTGIKVLTVSTPQELKESMNRLLKDVKFKDIYKAQLQEALKNSFGEIDSNASRRLAELL